MGSDAVGNSKNERETIEDNMARLDSNPLPHGRAAIVYILDSNDCAVRTEYAYHGTASKHSLTSL